MKYAIILVLFLACNPKVQHSSATKKTAVIAYYAGDAIKVNGYPIEKLSHVIFSFCHLKGNKLSVDDNRDSLTIKHLVSLKKRNPALKVLLSLGGWGGCETCSEVFSSTEGRHEFATSVKKLNDYFGTDGIDLDWEYPAIPGYPGHRYAPEDKRNFTLLVEALRKELGSKHEISFAAGGFTKFLQESVEWDKVWPMVTNINLMTYDLVHGFSEQTGHHTPLYSTPQQLESTDRAVRFLDSIGVPKSKLVIGAAFYGRIFEVNENVTNGLYQRGKFVRSLPFLRYQQDSLEREGFHFFWDDVAQAPYLFSPSKKLFITLDNERSVALKAKYAIDQKLFGIMFWELGNDKMKGGLLEAIHASMQNTSPSNN